jgi:hypothetical protein
VLEVEGIWDNVLGLYNRFYRMPNEYFLPLSQEKHTSLLGLRVQVDSVDIKKKTQEIRQRFAHQFPTPATASSPVIV